MRPVNSTILCATVLAVAVCLGGCACPAWWAGSGSRGREAQWVCSLEDGTTQGWEGTGGATVAVAAEHPASGTRSLRANLPAGQYPGIGIDFKAPQDWSACDAFRFRVFNAASGPLTVCVRVDDADSRNFATRFNNDMYPHRLAPGDNEVGVPIAALRQGSFLARGLDVRRIKVVRIFSIDLKKPATLFFDDLRILRRTRAGPATLPLADLGAKPPKWTTTHGAVATALRKPGSAADMLKLELPTGGTYPGVSFQVAEPNWLGYGLLSFTAHCPPDAPSPRNLALKITDAVGRSQTVTCPLQKGDNSVCFPLEMVSSVSLGRVSELMFFTGRPEAAQTVSISAPVLSRTRHVDYPTVRNAEAASPALTLDMAGFRVARNTCFIATIYIPLADGTTRVVRCNSPGRNVVKYAVGADAFAGHAAGKPVRIWLYVSDHGSWCWWHRTAAYQGTPLVVRFERPPGT